MFNIIYIIRICLCIYLFIYCSTYHVKTDFPLIAMIIDLNRLSPRLKSNHDNGNKSRIEKCNSKLRRIINKRND